MAPTTQRRPLSWRAPARTTAPRRCPRRSFAVALAALAIGGAAGGTAGCDARPPRRAAAHPASEAAQTRLATGNRRFHDREPLHHHESPAWRRQLLAEQHPFATVVGCADSRVPPELLFDQGFGDLFVIRVAGNVVDDDVAGSVEYAVDHLHTPLVVVLGHTSCGAVTAALEAGLHEEPHEVEVLLSHIEPCLAAIDKRQPRSAQVQQAVEANVRQSVRNLAGIPDLARAVAEGRTEIVGAVYDLGTGQVRFLDGARAGG